MGHALRVLCNGKTLAFQAKDRGSIPLTRFLRSELWAVIPTAAEPCDRPK